MGLLSLFKQKQETPSSQDSGEYRSRAEADSQPTSGNGKRADGARKSKIADPILPEKKRARRRLIGAVALVLAAVIGLPMVLDSEPKPLADDIAIQIPSKDKLTTDEHNTAPKVVIKQPEPIEEIIDPPQLETAPQTPVKTPSNLPVAAKTESKTEIKTESKPEPKATLETKAVPKAEAKTDAKTDAKTETKSDIKTEVKSSPVTTKSPANNDDAVRALAILEGKTPPKAAADTLAKEHSSYVVQVAALASQEKVHELQDKLKAAGIQSHTQKVATTTGDKIRIRVGPFQSKEDADKMRARLVKIGLSGTLIPN